MPSLMVYGVKGLSPVTAKSIKKKLYLFWTYFCHNDLTKIVTTVEIFLSPK